MILGATTRRAVRDTSYKILTGIIGNRQGLVTLPIMSGPAKGLRIRADLVRRQDAYFWGKYDRRILEYLSRVLRQGWCVWDCGTYLGFYTCFFARGVGISGQVIAIEPDLRNLAATLDNVALNGLKNVRSANIAIGYPSGEVDFLLSEDTNSHLPNCYAGDYAQAERWRDKDLRLRSVKIKCVTPDQAAFEESLPRPDLIKIDIEGAERDALGHMWRLATELRPIIVLELHNPECDAAAWRFALDTGYELHSMNEWKRITSADRVRGTLLCVPPGRSVGLAY